MNIYKQVCLVFLLTQRYAGWVEILRNFLPNLENFHFHSSLLLYQVQMLFNFFRTNIHVLTKLLPFSMPVMVVLARPPSPLQGRAGLSRSNDGGGRNGGITGFRVSLDIQEWGGLMSCKNEKTCLIFCYVKHSWTSEIQNNTIVDN